MTMQSSPRSSAPTVRDVAALAGVSPMTVSRTMSGGVNVRPEVQERVREAVEALGYRRNNSARNTRLGRPTGLVGIAVTNIGNPYYSQVALGVEEIAGGYGRQIEGLILVPAGNGLELPDARRLAGIPLVLASRSIGGLEADTVLVDDIGGARAGTQGLLDDGHRRIAFLGDAAGISTTRRRFEGFRLALTGAGIDMDENLLAPCRNAAGAESEVRRLLASTNPPTAFFSTNNRTTVGALRAICEYRNGNTSRPVPAMACFDDVELADLLRVPLIMMSHDPKELGKQAARLLFDRLAGSQAGGPQEVQIGVEIHRFWTN